MTVELWFQFTVVILLVLIILFGMSGDGGKTA